MGKYLEGTIRCFKPDNTDKELYIETSDCAHPSLAELIEQAKGHFGENVDISQVEISAEHVHTRCLGLDYYDPSDWTDFIVLTLKPEASQ